VTQHFASDNYAGMCPEATHWFLEANASGHQPAYGDDLWTQRVSDRLRELFQTDCDVYFVFNGTAANSLALASMCQSYHSVICTPMAHIETDECGGPEFFSNKRPYTFAQTNLSIHFSLATRRRTIHSEME